MPEVCVVKHDKESAPTALRIFFGSAQSLLYLGNASFNIKSRFNGSDKLADLLLEVAKDELTKKPHFDDFMGSEKGDLCYNRSGS